jgi:hypothetical protein
MFFLGVGTALQSNNSVADKKNSVYVTGFPFDITEKEVGEHSYLKNLLVLIRKRRNFIQ